jgi:hypothetical protein
MMKNEWSIESGDELSSPRHLAMNTDNRPLGRERPPQGRELSDHRWRQKSRNIQRKLEAMKVSLVGTRISVGELDRGLGQC